MKRLYSLFSFFTNKKQNQKVETVSDAANNYIVKNKQKFLFILNNNTNNTEDRVKWNTNMDPVIYSKKEYMKILEDADNPYENMWKTRILIETTPKGNILMHYDIYKQGFTYYSDTNGIDYHLLNTVAMNYVLKYRCLDFFIDDEITPEDKSSPLIKLYYVEETAEEKADARNIKNHDKTNEEKQKDDDFRAKLKDAPFVKYKKTTTNANSNANTNSIKPNTNTTSPNNYILNNYIPNNNKKSSTLLKEKNDNKTEKEYIRNRFICRGKLVNFSFIQKPEKKNKMNSFQTKYTENLSGEHNLQKTVLNYRDYKNKNC